MHGFGWLHRVSATGSFAYGVSGPDRHFRLTVFWREDVFFDNFEKEEYERELELSSANLKRFSDSKNYAPENEMLEWKWRADVAEKRASYLQNLKTERERKTLVTIDELKNKIKRLSQAER